MGCKGVLRVVGGIHTWVVRGFWGSSGRYTYMGCKGVLRVVGGIHTWVVRGFWG